MANGRFGKATSSKPSMESMDKSISSHEATNKINKETKKLASKVYKQGRNELNSVQHTFKEKTEKITQAVHKKPMTALLIAGGIGFILSAILRR